MRNMMIVLDSDLVITGINAAARAYLSVSERDAVGRPLDAIMPEARRMLLTDAAARVRDTGVGETFDRSEEHTSELQSLMRISYAVFCLQKHSYHNPYSLSYK